MLQVSLWPQRNEMGACVVVATRCHAPLSQNRWLLTLVCLYVCAGIFFFSCMPKQCTTLGL